jgi:hypothetical protein
MINNLKVLSGEVCWIYNNIEIKLEIPNAFFASENNETNLVKIDSGKNFIESKVYYYNFEGVLVLYYDLDRFTIEWFNQGLTQKLVIDNMNQVGFFPEIKRVFVISNFVEQELQGYNINGDRVFKVNAPAGFRMLFFTKIEEEIAVVCDGNKYQEDVFGRSRFNFLLNVDNGKLSKANLAY